MSERPVTTVLFDLDDTLFDHRHSCMAGVRAMRDLMLCLNGVSDEKLEQTYHYWLELVHKRVLTGEVNSEEARRERLTGFFGEFDHEVSEKELSVATERYTGAYQKSRRTVPGSVEVLQTLSGQVKLGILSNNLVEHQLPKIEDLEIGQFFESVIISEEAGAKKPEPEIFQIAIERLDSRPEETVMVGDSWESDIVGATSFGIRSVWVNRYGIEIPEEGVATGLDSFQPATAAVDAILNA
ncbi:MAG: HAD family hydrolase [Planctomycetota bacterium]|jgi:putative hydrolase of the HAD superfamily|nr:HAD family hydrolase [Planctomycetota bacterium]